MSIREIVSIIIFDYFPWVANVLTSSSKILLVKKRVFHQINWLGTSQWIWYRVCDADFNIVWARLPYCFSKQPLKRDFLVIYLTPFLESLTSKIKNVWGYSVFSKCLKFNLDLKNAAKNSEKYFCFWDNCLWIGIVKLSLLRTGYFSQAANVSTSSPNILHVNKTNFFQLNWLGSGQWNS